MTMCSVSRYTGGHRGRIWSCSFSPTQPSSFEHAHVHNGWRGSSYFGRMKTDKIQTSSEYTDWVILCASTSTVFPGNVVDDQMQTGTSDINSNSACQLNVNYQSSLDLASNFEVHSLFVWNEELNTAQMLSVTSAMRAQLGGSGLSTSNDAVGVHPKAPSPEPYCIVCPIGWWLDLVANDCIPCPTGTYGTLDGASTASTCLKCAAGTYNPGKGEKSCIKCPFNTYSEDIGSGVDSCMQCASGSYTVDIGSTTKDNCLYYVGDGSTSPCDITQQNEAFFVFLRYKPPIGINIFSKYDVVNEKIPELTGIDYVVTVASKYIKSEERAYLSVQSGLGNHVTSLYVPPTMACTWPVSSTPTYTRCWVARTNAHENWNVVCFKNNPPELVFDQVDQETSMDDLSVLVTGSDNWIHSTYTWDHALTNGQMKLVTKALRKEIGGKPYSEKTIIIPIQDTPTYNARLFLTMSSTDTVYNQYDDALSDEHAYCATCGIGYILDSETGDCNWCRPGYFINPDFDMCNACPYGLTVEQRSTTNAKSCIYYIGDGVTAPCDDHQQNDDFLMLLKKNPPIGINIFAEYDETTRTVPDARGANYIVHIELPNSKDNANVVVDSSFNSANPVTSLTTSINVLTVWPTPSNSVYTRCSVSRTENSYNWTVACFVNNTPQYVNDQVYDSNAHNVVKSITEMHTVNWIHSVYSWDVALSIDEMKIVTAALRKEIGGVPFMDSIAVVPITDLVKYKVRRYLTVSANTDSVDAGEALVKTDYCAVCPTGFLALISGDCVECDRHYFPDNTGASVSYCTECPPGYSETAGGCVMCPHGTYSIIGDIFQRCSVCPEGTQSPVASDDIQDCVCMSGHQAEYNGVVCNPCPENTFKSIIGVGGCETCSPELSSPEGSDGISNCVCTKGTFTVATEH
jgi:hypothetical protein